jgi:asparagine synthase (glutamine-hydrolysing)
LVPAGILHRPKQPYRAPDVSAVASASYAQQLLSESALKRSGYFDADKVSLLWRKAKAGRLHATRDQMALMGIVSTQIWHEQFIEGKALSLVAAA